MSWNPTEKEIADAFAADAGRRYEYFIHRVCETRKVWGLYQDGWASLDDEQQKFIPFWPHAVFAERFATGDWAGYTPKAIDLNQFLDRWISGMASEQIDAAVFPDAKGKAVIVTLTDLEANLRHELAEVHGETD